ncbi:DnaD domain-containing protein [Psychrobacillus sp. FSL K6-1267]|uniref:DnaD domain-containing protein n=1 Tax=Psychrobacillus sp. FSL K6-1267 TaxID=2921543 RepID=UPI0030FB89B7
MSIYRSVQVSFWQDAFVLDLTPEEKYFYIYLMTNSKASQIGIYELPKRIIETETGYNREIVEKLLNRFIEYKKIEYDDKTKEIFMVNWVRYNWNNSPKVISRVIQELDLIKNKLFVKKYVSLALESNTNKAFIEYGYSIGTVPILDAQEKEKEKEEEKEEEKEKQQEKKKSSVAVENEINPFEFYENNGFGAITPHVGEKVNAWIDDLSESLVLHAMKIAIENGALRWNYVESILKNWSTKKISSVEEVVALQEKWKLQHSHKHSKSVREEKVPEWFGKDANQPAPKTKSVVMDIEAERRRLRQELLGG